MRKKAFTFLFLGILLGISSCNGDSSSQSNGSTNLTDFTFSYYEEEGGYYVGDYNGSAAEIWIPQEAELEGVKAPVVGISSYAFSHRPSLKTIHLPDSLHTIKDFAFASSEVEKLVTTPFLVNIDAEAFSNSKIEFKEKDGVRYLPGRYGDYGYAVSYFGLTSAKIELPEECEAIYDDVFIGNQTITVSKRTMGFGSLGPNAHYYPYDKEEELELNVTKAGKRAFYQWGNLKKVTLQRCVQHIDENAFYQCSQLERIEMNEELESIGNNAFASCENLDFIELGASLKTVESGAFSLCIRLKSLELGSCVKSIDSYAFSSCRGLKSVSIPEQVSYVGSMAFSGCESLENVYVASDQTSFGENVFSNCNKLKNIQISDNSTQINPNLYFGCESIDEIVISPNIETIGTNAFANCTSIKRVSIPETVKQIEKDAFSGCYFDFLRIPVSLAGLYGCQTKEIELYGEGSIGDSGVFAGEYFEKMSIPCSVAGLYGAERVYELHITGAGTIESKAFYNQDYLSKVILDEGIESIGENAFAYCDGLTSVTIPNTVTSVGLGAFENCYNLNSTKYGNAYYLGNSTNRYHVLWYAGGITSIITDAVKTFSVHSDCKVIASAAFYAGQYITSVTLPSGLLSIDSEAFKLCFNLPSILIPLSVSYIGYDAFANCSALTINCEATSQPTAWSSSWNPGNRPVNWGYQA